MFTELKRINLISSVEMAFETLFIKLLCPINKQMRKTKNVGFLIIYIYLN